MFEDKKIKLLLCPGLDGTARLFRPLLEELPGYLQPVLISFPGDASLDYSDFVEIIRRQIPDEQFAILAESFSGPAAVRVARDCDRRLIGLVLASSFVSNPLPLPSWIVSLFTRKEFLRWGLRLPIGRYVLGKSSKAEVVALFNSVLQSLSPTVVSKRVLQVLTCDSREDLKRCAAPVLYLRPSQDWFVSHDCVDLIQKLSPSIRVDNIPGTHFILQSNPSEAAASIARFLETARGVGD